MTVTQETPSLNFTFPLHSENIAAEAILFADSFQTQLSIPDTSFRNNANAMEGPEYVLEQKGQIVAGGGYVRNYNFPYIDMYYEVIEGQRNKGFGPCFKGDIAKSRNESLRLYAHWRFGFVSSDLHPSPIFDFSF